MSFLFMLLSTKKEGQERKMLRQIYFASHQQFRAGFSNLSETTLNF